MIARRAAQRHSTAGQRGNYGSSSLSLSLSLSLLVCLETAMAGVAPSKVEVNLGPFPIDRYNSPGSASLINGCQKLLACTQNLNLTVRNCVQYLFQTSPNNYVSQGVTGVRFFFTLANGHYSDPFDSAGNVKASWKQNLRDFLQDLKNYGITHVTPTPMLDTWSGPPHLTSMEIRSDLCPGQPETKFTRSVPWLPYLQVFERPEGNSSCPQDQDCFDPQKKCNCAWMPDRTCGNGSYFASPRNPIFWGWQRFFNVMGAVIELASPDLGVGLQFDALDYYQETNLGEFTVQARFLCDFVPNGASTDVLGQLRTLLAARGYPTGVVIPSVNSPPKPYPANGDCPSYWGDSALLLHLSAQTGALAGPDGRFGVPPTRFPMPLGNNVRCVPVGAPIPMGESGLIELPVAYAQPTSLDMHAGILHDSDLETGQFATTVFSGMQAFLVYRGFGSNTAIVFGESTAVTAWYPPGAAAAMINGYKASPLYHNRAAKVVLRPWHTTMNAKHTSIDEGWAPAPCVINPPYDPANP